MESVRAGGREAEHIEAQLAAVLTDLRAVGARLDALALSVARASMTDIMTPTRPHRDRS